MIQAAWRRLFAWRSPSLAQQLAARITERPPSESAPLLVISHDAHLAGAQRLLLDLLTEWHRTQPFPIKVICVGGGVLRSDFEKLFPTLVLEDFAATTARDRALLQFVDTAPRAIYANTVVNGPLLGELRALGRPIITHCHELQAAIERWAPVQVMSQTLVNSDYFIAASNGIAHNLRVRHCVPQHRLEVIHAFINDWTAKDSPAADECAQMRAELDIHASDIVVFGCGTTDWRKGPDLFVTSAISACQRDPRLKFIWIGGEESPNELCKPIQAAGLHNRIRFIGSRLNARRYFYVGHLFALSSREDPCALVALEAANAGLPVICFDGAGDIPEVLGPDAGAVVPFADTTAFTAALIKFAADPDLRLRTGSAGRERVRCNHSAASAANHIEALIGRITTLPLKKLGRPRGDPLVSVIVPNYNHERFLQQRLDSISNQSLRDIEIILLDDASTDNSPSLLKAFAAREPRSRWLFNESNSGSTFKQWRTGLTLAQGKYVWIAESDDFAAHDLLTRAVRRLEADPSIVLAQVHSMMVDPQGNRLGYPNDWLDDLAPGRWNHDFENGGIAEIREYLSQKNTIPNASAVVFRNFPGIEHLVDDTMRLCADWLFWIRLLARGRYAFIAAALNYWRQNTSNARSRPPGVLEWEEGQRVLEHTAHILNLDASDRARLLAAFRARCVAWSGGALDLHDTVSLDARALP